MNSPIFDLDNWREIGATLSRNKTRTFLTAFGIFWGTAILAILLGGSSGAEGMIRRQFAGFATNMAFMSGERTTISYRGFNKGTPWTLNDTDISDMRRLLPNIESSSGIIAINATVAYGSKSSSTSVGGVEEGYSGILLPIIYEGRFINTNDVSLTKKVAVIGRNLARELFGSESPLGKYIAVGNVYYQVVGVAGQTSEASIIGRLDDIVVVPFTTLRRANARGTNVDFFIFTARSGHTPSDMRPDIERIIRKNHPIHPDDHEAMMFSDISTQFKMVENIFAGITFIAIFIGAGTLIAGIIGVGNIMWIIVKERTGEFGIRRAIGARPVDVILQVLSEGVILTLIAGVAGLSFATLVLHIADVMTADPLLGHAGFEITFSDAVIIMAVFTILGSLAGLIPAIKAMKIKPVEAINAK